jgi:hypothetical protein
MAFGDFGKLSNEVFSVTRPEPRPTLAPKADHTIAVEL